MSPSTPSSSSAPGNASPISWLPAEILFIILSYVDEPLHLYSASLTSRAWHGNAVDPRLWEHHYWRYYRGGGSKQQGTKHDRVMAQRREQYRREGMRVWLQKAVATSFPTDWLRPFLSRSPTSGELIVFPPLVKTTLAYIHMLGDDEAEEVVVQLGLFALSVWSGHGPADPEKGIRQLSKHLKKVFGRAPSPLDHLYAELNHHGFARKLVYSRQTELPRATMPHFLDSRLHDKTKSLPNFYKLFVKRMSRDDEVLRELDRQTRLTTGRLDSMLRFVDQYGDGARDILFAVIATQQATLETVGVFTADLDDEGKKSLRARDVHAAAAAGSSQPTLSRRNCIALFALAQQALGHLQRREAISTIQKCKERWASPSLGAASHSLRQQVWQSCLGIEEVLGTIALFRFGEKNEISAYLDLLALHVWANVEIQRCGEETMQASGHNPFASRRSASSLASWSDPTAPPSTRRLFKQVHQLLYGLDFGLAFGDRFYDVHKLFIQTPLWCPLRRDTSPLMQTAIVCAVARRLGIAASLVNTPGMMVAVVVEDGAQPASWRDDDSQEWGRFFYGAGNGEFTILQEIGDVRRFVEEGGEAEGDDFETTVQPVSPFYILECVGGHLHTARERERRTEQPAGYDGPASEGSGGVESDVGERISTSLTSAAPKDDLEALCAYLTGRQAVLPSALPASVLPSSFAMLPRGPRSSSRSVSKDVELASFWIFRVIKPSMVHGPQRADAMFAHVFFGDNIGHDHYHCDAALLLGVNGLDVPQEMARARAANHSGDPQDEDADVYINSADEEQGYSSRSQLRSFAAQLFGLDRRRSIGMGGAGGSDPLGAYASNTKLPSLLDHSHPANARVLHRVGTIFKHRKFGYHAVVVGWDSVCRAATERMTRMRVDSFPQGGRNQPFYHVIVGEDESRKYVPQCYLEVVRVPAGATVEEATDVLRPLVPLLNARALGKAFSTVRVAPWSPIKTKPAGEKAKGSSSTAVEAQQGGEVTLVMNEWMREAWPFD